MNGLVSGATGAQCDTGCPYPTILIERLRAKKGNEDMVPSALYVACLELYIMKAGSQPSSKEPCYAATQGCTKGSAQKSHTR